MAVTTNPSELAAAAKCYCYDKETAKKVKLYLLAVIAGLDGLTPQELANRAKCYCFDPVTAAKVELYLDCLIANAGGSPSGPCANLEGIGDPT